MTTRHISVILPHRARLQHTSLQRVQTATSGLGELFEITRGSADVSGWLLSLSCSVYQAIIMSDQPFYGLHNCDHLPAQPPYIYFIYIQTQLPTHLQIHAPLHTHLHTHIHLHTASPRTHLHTASPPIHACICTPSHSHPHIPPPQTHITHTESPGVCGEVHTPECPEGSDRIQHHL